MSTTTGTEPKTKKKIYFKPDPTIDCNDRGSDDNKDSLRWWTVYVREDREEHENWKDIAQPRLFGLREKRVLGCINEPDEIDETPGWVNKDHAKLFDHTKISWYNHLETDEWKDCQGKFSLKTYVHGRASADSPLELPTETFAERSKTKVVSTTQNTRSPSELVWWQEDDKSVTGSVPRLLRVFGTLPGSGESDCRPLGTITRGRTRNDTTVQWDDPSMASEYGNPTAADIRRRAVKDGGAP